MYLNRECFVIRPGYETARPVSSEFNLTVPSGAQKILGALQLLGEKLVTYPLHRVEVELKALHRNPCKSLQALVECLLALLGQHKYVHLIFNQLPLQRLIDLILT